MPVKRSLPPALEAVGIQIPNAMIQSRSEPDHCEIALIILRANLHASASIRVRQQEPSRLPAARLEQQAHANGAGIGIVGVEILHELDIELDLL